MHPRVLKRPEHPISRRQIDVIALKVLYRLIDAGFVAYLVGGAVRDLMLGRRPKDFDVGTTAHPEEVRALFRNSRLIGRRFPLVHVYFGGGRIIEVATFRANPNSPVISSPGTAAPYDNSFGTAEQDAFRRDFTINALFYDPGTFCVLDYVSGLADLELGLLRTIGEPELRMREDPVRMVRAVRLAAKLGFAIEPELRAAIETCRKLVLEASPPRLVEEIHRMLAADGSARALQLMREMRLLEVLMPDWFAYLEQTPGAWDRAARNLQALEAARQSGAALSRPMILAALFADCGIYEANGSSAHVPAIKGLTERGFSRAETSRTRLLLCALWRFRTRRRLDRMARQAYYNEAKSLYELVAPTYGLDPTAPTGGRNSYAGGVANRTQKERRTRRRRRSRRTRPSLGVRSSNGEAAHASGQVAALCGPQTLVSPAPRS